MKLKIKGLVQVKETIGNCFRKPGGHDKQLKPLNFKQIRITKIIGNTLR